MLLLRRAVTLNTRAPSATSATSTMGMVFGIQREEEPAYTVEVDRTSNANTQYEIRSYGTRYAIEASYGSDPKNDRSPFMALAGFIGVMSEPQNEGKAAIAMTAPVSMQSSEAEKKKEGMPIAMTAPVAMQTNTQTKNKKMQFFLPAEFDSLEKIPKPTNPDVTIQTIPPAVGAVHRYSGTFSDTKSKDKAKQLIEQLKEDGLDDIEEDKALANYQFWGYNPPFTIPMFRRNEIFVELSEEQAKKLKEKFATKEEKEEQ